MAEFFTSQPTGALLLQSAQALIALNRQRKAQEAQEAQQKKNFELQERNLEIRERNAQIQEEFAENQRLKIEAENDPEVKAFKERLLGAQTRKAEAEAKQAELELKGGGAKEFSTNEKLKLLETTQSRLRQGLLVSFADRKGFDLLAGDSVASLRKERAELLEGAPQNNAVIKELGSGPEVDRARNALERLDTLNSILTDPEFVNGMQRIDLMSPDDPAVFNEARSVFAKERNIPESVADEGLRHMLTEQANARLDLTSFLPNVTPETFGSAALDSAQGDPSRLKALLIASGRLGGTNAGVAQFLERLLPFFLKAGLSDDQIREAQINLINSL